MESSTHQIAQVGKDAFYFIMREPLVQKHNIASRPEQFLDPPADHAVVVVLLRRSHLGYHCDPQSVLLANTVNKLGHSPLVGVLLGAGQPGAGGNANHLLVRSLHAEQRPGVETDMRLEHEGTVRNLDNPPIRYSPCRPARLSSCPPAPESGPRTPSP